MRNNSNRVSKGPLRDRVEPPNTAYNIPNVGLQKVSNTATTTLFKIEQHFSYVQLRRYKPENSIAIARKPI